jgi:hypothetical protein
VYLRSSLARYFLMMRGWKMLCERNGVHLSDVEGDIRGGGDHPTRAGQDAE